ncbi:MAG: molybdopterin-synthase adenylyltransferase MoeB [Halofilum sp. (in: g-proteobacteria)]|nr:molybdopterin-synthase adenylyltransferase MoeB [Halofilum sp. (in: g-proteobacteria)]
MSNRDESLQRLRGEIPEVTPEETRRLVEDGAALVDVREAEEIAQGSPPGALRLGRGYLELRIEQSVPDTDRTVICMCGGGSRSLFAADDLRRLGYRDVRSMAGGFNRWKDEGLPFEVPQVLDADARARYARQLTLPEIGEAGQGRLAQAKVLLIGAGGLGSPAAYYLAAAGVGTLTLVDHDTVDRSNLQRQILHTDDRVGMSKVDSARRTLNALNPAVRVEGHEERLSSDNVERIFAGHDLVVDGSDNFATRYLVNDACVKLGLPNVHAAVFRFEGQASVFWPAGGDDAPCYRCLYPEPPPPEQAPSCAEAGVMGVLPGIMGTIQALEALKLLLGVGQPLTGRLLCFDGLAGEFRELRIRRDPECAYCGSGEFPGYIDYQQFCAAG